MYKQQSGEYKILVLDNDTFHKATRLIIPNNIPLCFLPPYSPRLNPARKVWALLKRKITNKVFEKLEKNYSNSWTMSLKVFKLRVDKINY